MSDTPTPAQMIVLADRLDGEWPVHPDRESPCGWCGVPEPHDPACEVALYRLSSAALRHSAEALELLKARDWQPIETAPKDGTDILIGWFELEGQRAMHVAYWHSHLNAWCQTHSGFTDDPNWQPTHWMPLPEPPSLAPTREGC